MMGRISALPALKGGAGGWLSPTACACCCSWAREGLPLAAAVILGAPAVLLTGSAATAHGGACVLRP